MVLAFFLTTTSGLPQDLWDPLTPHRAAATAPSGGVSLAIAIAGFVLVAVIGFVVGEWTPRRRRMCRIVLSKTGDQSEFLVLAGQRVITRSDPFPIGDDEAAHAAHDILIARLDAEGLHPSPWYDARLATPA